MEYPEHNSLSAYEQIVGDRHVEIDERFIAPYLRCGFDSMEVYLAKHNRFAIWLEGKHLDPGIM